MVDQSLDWATTDALRAFIAAAFEVPVTATNKIQGENSKRILGALQLLDEREIYVLTRRFGLNGSEKCTLKAVGNAMGISTERVRQIEAKALRRLRHPSKAYKYVTMIDRDALNPRWQNLYDRFAPYIDYIDWGAEEIKV